MTPPPITPAPITPAPGTDPPGVVTSYLPPQADPLIGQTLAGRYLIQKKLGEGGMGAVYLATHNLLEKQVALKVLHGEFARKPDLIERFMQEAKAASRIRHENVIDISDFGTTPDGLVFFAMELLKGHDLHDEVARARLAGQLLPWERSKKIFLQICAALSAAHALGIVHRDLKPENIYLVEFLGEPDFVKLLDFGIAKLTEGADGERKMTKTGMLFGTPEYMSPEQARGEKHIDHRVDVYAMGCILFQLVTGRVPFEAENFMGVLSLHLTEPPPVIPVEVFDSIGAPRALAGVIDKALAKDRNQRYATIDELAREVRRVSGDKLTGPVVLPSSVPAPPTTATMNRVKTQWTGSLSVPEIETSAPAPASKLPKILAAVVLLGGAAGAAAFFAGRAPGGGGGGSGTASGSQAVAVATPPVQPPVATPSASDAGVEVRPDAAEALAPLPAGRVAVRIDSTPRGAEVRDPATGGVLGRTPYTFTTPASRGELRFLLHRRDYVDAIIQVVPDRAKVDHVERLERDTGQAARPVAAGSASRPAAAGSGAPAPTGTPAQAPVDVPGPPKLPGPPPPEPPRLPPPPKPEDDGIDPVLKADPSRAGGSAGGAP